MMISRRAALVAALSLIALPALAADYPAPKQGDWIAKDFRFHTGEVMPEVRLHYTTVGAPTGEPVLILHGTGGSAANFLNAGLCRRAVRRRPAARRQKYFIILPDALGAGKSTKPSDGLRAKFPLYNYADMVAAQHRLVTEGLGIKHLRLVIGNSMGGMQTWMWGAAYPDFMDALVPMAAQPTAMSSRNWMMRRMITDAVRNDPDWKNGNYTTQPRAFRTANAFFRIATSGGTLAYQKLAPTREKADKLLERHAGRAVQRRRQRFPLPVGFLARLRRLAGPGENPGRAAGDQLRRRRAQSAGNRADDGSAQAREERQALSDPGQRRHARPRHHRHGEVLEAAVAGIAANRAEADDVSAATAPPAAPG